MAYIIMMHGLPLAGKSTAAKKISDFLNKNNIRSEVIKSVVARYNKDNIMNFTEKSIDETIPQTKEEKDRAYHKYLKEIFSFLSYSTNHFHHSRI